MPFPTISGTTKPSRFQRGSNVIPTVAKPAPVRDYFDEDDDEEAAVFQQSSAAAAGSSSQQTSNLATSSAPDDDEVDPLDSFM